jgi:hypothetical protein
MANGHGNKLKFDRQPFGHLAVGAGYGHDGDVLSRSDWALFAIALILCCERSISLSVAQTVANQRASSTFEGANPFGVQMTDGTSALSLFNGNQIIPLTTGYLPYSSTFIAIDSTLTLSFFDAGLSTTGKVSWIDSVVIRDLTVVPEPATTTSIAVALILLLVQKMRMHR